MATSPQNPPFPNNGVVGSDGGIPVYDPEGLWKIWALWEIWQGPGNPAENRFVPKIKDYVRDPDNFQTWIVDHLDPVTLKPTLREIHPYNMSFSVDENDVLLGSGPETYRAYLNDRVFPHVMSVDVRLKIGGTMASYAKVFLGTDTNLETGEVISKTYDNSGNFVSDAVELELVALDSHTNYAIKSVKRFHVTQPFPNNEVVTVVIYASDGMVVSKTKLWVENTDTINDITNATKYVADISIESYWLSQTDQETIQYPLNIPMNALNLMGVVLYSDGSTLRLPVDGGKFAMLGLDNRLSTIVGQPRDLVLRYQLSTNETAYASTGVNGRYVTKPYKIITLNPNNSIAVKLFGYPYWVNEASGYRMRWWLLNMERNIWFEATDHVLFAENTGPFDPKLYGYLQRKAVTVNLQHVSPLFIPFIHTQQVDIVLNSPPSIGQTDWTVGTEASNDYPRFGTGILAALINSSTVNLASGFTTYNEWLEAMFHRTRPLIDPTSETTVPNPTHFVVHYGVSELEFPISSWNQNLNIGSGIANNQTLMLRFIRKTAGGDLNLSIAAAIIKSPNP